MQLERAREKKTGGKRLLTRVVPTLLYGWWPRYLDSFGKGEKSGGRQSAWCWGSGQEGSALSNRISGPSCPSVIASPSPRGFPLLLPPSPPFHLPLYPSTFAPIVRLLVHVSSRIFTFLTNKRICSCIADFISQERDEKRILGLTFVRKK